MSKKIEQAPEYTSAQLEQAEEVIGAVNLDEVTIEIIQVKVREYKEVEAIDDDDNPLLDDSGLPLKYRKPVTRTAHIQNFVPLPIYNKVVGMQGKLKGTNLPEQIPVMTELVLEVWKISEPWMTLKKLNEGVDFQVIMRLFQRFFNSSRLMNSRA